MTTVAALNAILSAESGQFTATMIKADAQVAALEANVSKANAQMGASASSQAAATNAATESAAGGMVKYGAAALAAGALVTAAMMKAASLADENRTATMKLDNSVTNSTSVTKANEAALLDQASALSKTTLTYRNAIVAGDAMLVQTGATAAQVEKLSPLINDISRKMGIDYVQASKAVGMALDGNAAGLKRLKIPLDANLYAVDRMAAITKALGTAQGYAAAETQTFSGQMEMAKKTAIGFAREIGVGASQAFSTMLGPLQNAESALVSLPDSMKNGIGMGAAYAGVALTLGGAFSMAVGAVAKTKANVDFLRGAQEQAVAVTEAETVATEQSAVAAVEKSAAESRGFMTTAEKRIAAEQAAAAEIELAAATQAAAGAAAEQAAADEQQAAAARSAARANATMSTIAVGGAMLAIGAVMAWTSSLNEATKVMEDASFKNLDFTKPTTSGKELQKSISGIRDQAKQLGDLDTWGKVQAGLSGQATALSNTTAQAAEYAKQLQQSEIAVTAISRALGITKGAARSMAEALHVDPSKLTTEAIPIFEKFRKGIQLTDADLQTLGITQEDVADATVKAVDNMEKSVQGVVSAYQSAISANQAVTDAQDAAGQSAQAVADAQDSYGQAVERVADAQYAASQSAGKIADAEQGVADAHRSAETAARSLWQAESALAQIQQGGEGKISYDLDKQEAALRLKEAQQGLIESEKQLTTAKTPEERAKAQNEIEQKRIDIARDQIAVNNANSAQAKDLAAANQAVQDATQSLSAAQRSEIKAAEAVDSAHRDAAKAAEAVSRANYEASKAYVAIGRAQHDEMKANENITKAQYAASAAALDLKNKQLEAAAAAETNTGAVEGLRTKLENLAAQSPGLAKAIAPLLAALGQAAGDHPVTLGNIFGGGSSGTGRAPSGAAGAAIANVGAALLGRSDQIVIQGAPIHINGVQVAMQPDRIVQTERAHR